MIVKCMLKFEKNALPIKIAMKTSTRRKLLADECRGELRSLVAFALILRE